MNWSVLKEDSTCHLYAVVINTIINFFFFFFFLFIIIIIFIYFLFYFILYFFKNTKYFNIYMGEGEKVFKKLRYNT